MGPLTYSRDDFDRIFARAAELEVNSLPSVPSRDEYTLSEMKAIAVQAGINPDLIERATREIAVSGERTPKGFISRQIEVSFPVRLSEDRALRVLSAVRSAVRQQGDGEVSLSGFSWTSDDQTLLLTAHDEGDRTRVNVSSTAARAVSFAVILGGLAGWVTAGSFEPMTEGAFFGGVAVGIGVTAAMASAAVGKARRQIASVLTAASRTMTEPETDGGRLENGEGSSGSATAPDAS